MNEMLQTTSNPKVSRSSRRGAFLRIHRWLGLGAALLFLVQAITGTILAFHFELQDASLSTVHRPTDLAALEKRIDSLRTPAGAANITWIWTTAGLKDRYVILYSDASGTARTAHVDGGGTVFLDRDADQLGFLGFMREVHMTLASGEIGHWILAVSGILLITNIIAGVVLAWPRRKSWRTALKPLSKGNSVARLYSWHRALGLYLAIPALAVVGTGTLIQFEEPLFELLNTPEVSLPPNPPRAPDVGFAIAAQAATRALSGSAFVGTTFPSAQDASYYAWVRGPGELYRPGGYGGSLVVVDANNGSVRGAYPAKDANAAYTFVGALYPLHTGEALGLPGRILGMLIGIWLTAMTLLGLFLWQRRRRQRAF
jgi:uncharacterized iron-regulated membrane protein